MGVPSPSLRPFADLHLFERLVLARQSRGQFLRRGAVVLGGLAGYEALRAAPAFAANSDPNPIPGGFAADFSRVPKDPLIHVLPPGVGFEMSTITDFKGHVGAAEIQGKATGGGSRFSFDVDMRFMRGLYAGVDGRLRHGSFGFI
jgi:hypothetical protein